jgi:hypothetical protein
MSALVQAGVKPAPTTSRSTVFVGAGTFGELSRAVYPRPQRSLPEGKVTKAPFF